MKKYLWAIAGLVLFGCTKPQATTVNPAPSPDTTLQMAYTPLGAVPKSRIFMIEQGAGLHIHDGHVFKIRSTDRSTLQDLGSIKRRTQTATPIAQSIAAPAAQPAVSPHFTPAGVGNNNWVTFAEWLDQSSGNFITYFSTTWTVPTLPTFNYGQLVYIFNGLENTGGSTEGEEILQPVLGFGVNGLGGQAYWSLYNMFVWQDLKGDSYYAVQLPVIPIAVGTSVTGIVQWDGYGPDGSSLYTCSFAGYANVLNVTEGADISEHNAAIPYIPDLDWAVETLESYNTNSSTSPAPTSPVFYPPNLKEPMTNIKILTDGVPGMPAPLSWTPQNLSQTDPSYDEYTTVVSNNASGSGEVDLYFHTPALINGASSVTYSIPQNGPSPIMVTPTITSSADQTVTITVTLNGPNLGSGSNTATLSNIPLIDYTSGTTQTLTVSGTGNTTASTQFSMTFDGSPAPVSLNLVLSSTANSCTISVQ